MIVHSVSPAAESGRVVGLTVRQDFAPDPGDAIAVRVDFAVFDPEPYKATTGGTVPTAAFVGRVIDAAPGTAPAKEDLVAGIGPLGDIVFAPPQKLMHIPQNREASIDDSLQALQTSLRCVLAAIGIVPGEQVGISGQGLGARLAQRQAEALTGTRVQMLSQEDGQQRRRGRLQPDEGTFDVMVDTTGDAVRWSQVFPQVRRHGRVLLLLPPGPQVQTFDFYPRVHKGSYTLRACRWPSDVGAALNGSMAMSLEGISTSEVQIAGVETIALPSADPAAIVCRFVAAS